MSALMSAQVVAAVNVAGAFGPKFIAVTPPEGVKLVRCRRSVDGVYVLPLAD